MLVQFTRPFRGHAEGSVVDVDAAVAREWIDRGLVQAHGGAEVEVKAMDLPPRDKAVKRRRVQRKAQGEPDRRAVMTRQDTSESEGS